MASTDALQAARGLLQHCPDATAVVDLSRPEIPVVYSNPAMEALAAPIGMDGTDPVTLASLLGLDCTSADWLLMLDRLNAGQSSYWQCRAYREQREAFWAELTCYPLASPELAVIVVRDQSPVWLAQQTLRTQAQRSDAVLSEVSEAVIQADSALVLNHINPAAQALTGWLFDAALGRPVADVVQLVATRSGASVGNPLLNALLTGDEVPWTHDAALCRPDGSRVPVSYRTRVIRDTDGGIAEALLLLRNTSEASMVADAMAHLAWHDALTDLPNRSVFEDRMAQAQALAARHQHPCGVLLVDVANHEQTVEAYGQDTGDELLQTLALRLRAAFRRSDTVCRIGNARFAVILPLMNEKANASVLTTKAQSAATQAVRTRDHRITPLLRTGVALFPGDGDSVPALIDHAIGQLAG